MKMFREAFDLVRAHKREYLVLNLVYYGLFAFGAVAALLLTKVYPALPEGIWQLTSRIDAQTNKLAAFFLEGARRSGIIPLVMASNFIYYLVVPRLLGITLPSLVVPFSGLLIGFPVMLFNGIRFGFTWQAFDLSFHLTHTLWLILSLQASVLVFLGAYLQGIAFLFPQRMGAASRGEGFTIGLKQSLRLYLLVALVLLVLIIYEPIIVFWLEPLLQ